MKTEPRKPDLRIICDCCPEVATRKGGDYPYYLCDRCGDLPVEDVDRRMREKHGMR